MSFLQKYVFLFLFVAGTGPVVSQNRKIDSLKNLLRADKEDTNKVNNLNNLGWEFRRSNSDTSIVLSNQALTVAEKIGWKKGIARSLNFLGYFYKANADYSKALDCYSKALQLNKEMNDKTGIANQLCNIANVNSDKGDYSKALDYYFKALKIAEEIGNKRLQVNNLSNIGLVYADQNNYSKTLEYYFKALRIAEEPGPDRDKNKIAAILGNIGNVYNFQTNYSKALDYYFKVLTMNQELQAKQNIAVTLGNIGSVYRNQADSAAAKENTALATQDKYSKALEYYFKALNMKEEMGDKLGVAINRSNIGSLYIATNKFKEAETNLLESLKLCKEIGALNNEKEAHYHLSDLYNKTNRFELALTHYKNYITVRDSISNDENAKKQIRSEMNFEFEKKSAADSIKNSEAKKFEEIKHQQEISRQRTFTYGGIAGFLIMIVVAGVSFIAFRNKKKANIEIQHQKHLVEEKQKEILDSIYYARRIQRSLLTSEKYISRNLNRMMK
ncbi:MAG: tetratricopeptide repeat protein [Bacteroidia bacterium]|nr:tetratricopeptide repeat protein [Bacteroidia bacterium]